VTSLIFSSGFSCQPNQGEFLSDGYYVSTVGKDTNEHVISNYVKNQRKEKYHKEMRSKKPRLLQIGFK
jgi:REP element-mobilizing transposase RayT